ncbi:hypothetical protein BS47DRAFT_1363260 [Hydnum rufescens UP504]|uniref:Uncharacterized protein n=1 Tax=Hydnum rufescens UP504 TaxID=1448309 RepID=A0A9P6DSK3_9AGAM|nr:hypothetical protein BS47DRAFT_1363260 [Hydnum rufescens UP504]
MVMRMRVEGVAEEAKQEGKVMYERMRVEVKSHVLVCSGTQPDAGGTETHSTDEEYLAAPQIHSLSCIIISSITRLGVTPGTLRDTGFPLRHCGPSSNPGGGLGIFQCSRQVCIFFVGLGRGLGGINRTWDQSWVELWCEI